MAPTKIYVKPLLAALKETSGIKALAHITGGGLPENLPRVLPKGSSARIDLSKISVPPVFSWLAEKGGVAEAEMLRTFNCGIGMVVVVASDEAAAVSDALQAAGETVVEIGRIETAGSSPVLFDGALKL